MTTIREAGTLTTTGPGHATIDLITPGKGSSGLYPREVLEAAGRDAVFPAGTKMFVNHQTESEAWSRPEGDLTLLAGVLTENARWDADRDALVAEARIYSHWRPLLHEMKDDIGVSIRATADMADSPDGRVVERINQAISVDFVTEAGRGGRIVELMESAHTVQEARSLGQHLEARLHTQFTVLADDTYGDGRLTREERIILSGALGDALAAFTARIETDAPDLYARDVWTEPETTETTEASQPPVGQGSNTLQGKDGIMPKITLEEADHAVLVEKASRVDTTDAALVEAREKIAALEAEKNEAARREHVTRLVEAEFTSDAPVTKRLLIEALTPDTVTDEQITQRAREAAAEIAVTANGAGQVRGLGSNHGTNDLTETDSSVPTWDELSAVKGA